MKLRLVGIEPLVGIQFQHQHFATDSAITPPCETCDGCGKPIPARHIYFDGERFLCAGCRQKQRLTQTS